MNFLKKLWYGKIRKKYYALHAIIENKTVVEFLYWDGDVSKLTYGPTQSLLLVTPEMDLKIGSKWDGQRWINP